MSVKLLTEQRSEFLSLKGCCKGLSESTLVKIPHCWKSHVTAHLSKHVSDFMEMMMMQNAQMHHMVLQNLMASTIQGNNNKNNLPPVLTDTQLVRVQQVGMLLLFCVFYLTPQFV